MSEILVLFQLKGLSSSRILNQKKENPKRNAIFTDYSLDSYSGILKCRFDTRLNHLLEENNKEEGS